MGVYLVSCVFTFHHPVIDETDILGRAGMAQTGRTDVKSVPPGSLIWQAQIS